MLLRLARLRRRQITDLLIDGRLRLLARALERGDVQVEARSHLGTWLGAPRRVQRTW